jgi:16S rRNA (uracil1498-N3)-methyltransferase
VAEPRRLFAPPEAFHDNRLLLDAARLRHLRTVLRLGPGDEFAVTDGAGAEYRARIEHLGRAEGRALVLERTEPARESTLETVLAQTLPKGDRIALVLEKAVELGVSGFIPVLSRRTVPGGGAAAAAARWRRIAESAVAQSGRTRLPVLHPPRHFEELVADRGLPDVRILLCEKSSKNLREVVDGQPAPRSVLVAVGPEGGWSEQEVRRARLEGFADVRFGPRILRTETAGIAALAVLQNRWGDLG